MSTALRATITLVILLAVRSAAFAETITRGRAAAITGDGAVQVNTGKTVVTVELSHLDCDDEDAEELRSWLSKQVFGKTVSVRTIAERAGVVRGEISLEDHTVVNQRVLADGLCRLDQRDPDPKRLYRNIDERQSGATRPPGAGS